MEDVNKEERMELRYMQLDEKVDVAARFRKNPWLSSAETDLILNVSGEPVQTFQGFTHRRAHSPRETTVLHSNTQKHPLAAGQTKGDTSFEQGRAFNSS